MKLLRLGPSPAEFPPQMSPAEALIRSPFIIGKRNRPSWGVMPPTRFKWLERADSPGALSSLLLKGAAVTQPAPLRHGRPKAASASLPPCCHGPASPAQRLGLLSFGGDTCTLSTDHFNPRTLSRQRENQCHPQRAGPRQPTQPVAQLNPFPCPWLTLPCIRAPARHS